MLRRLSRGASSEGLVQGGGGGAWGDRDEKQSDVM